MHKKALELVYTQFEAANKLCLLFVVQLIFTYVSAVNKLREKNFILYKKNLTSQHFNDFINIILLINYNLLIIFHVE